MPKIISSGDLDHSGRHLETPNPSSIEPYATVTES